MAPFEKHSSPRDLNSHTGGQRSLVSKKQSFLTWLFQFLSWNLLLALVWASICRYGGNGGRFSDSHKTHRTMCPLSTFPNLTVLNPCSPQVLVPAAYKVWCLWNLEAMLVHNAPCEPWRPIAWRPEDLCALLKSNLWASVAIAQIFI